MKRLAKLFFSVWMIFGAAGFVQAGFNLVAPRIEQPGIYTTFFIGAAAYLLLWLLIFSRRESFWSVFEHEATHAFFAMLFFKKVHAFTANRATGGSVKIEGRNVLITLSPYFFPLFGLMVLLLKPIIIPPLHPVINGLLGFTLMSHLTGLFQELRVSQPDLHQHGMFFSWIMVVFFNLLFAGMILASVADGWSGVAQFCRGGLATTNEMVVGTLRLFYDLAAASFR